MRGAVYDGDGGAMRAGPRPALIGIGVRPSVRAAPTAGAGPPPPLVGAVAARIHGRADIVAPRCGRIARCGKACGATLVSRAGSVLLTWRGPALMCTVVFPRVSTRSFVTSVVR